MLPNQENINKGNIHHSIIYVILLGQAMLICVIQSVLHHSTIYAQE